MAEDPKPAVVDADEIQAQKEADILRRVRNIRSKNMVEEQARLTGTDPSKTYEWINTDPRRVATFQAMEYVVCNKTNSPKLEGHWKKGDGTHVWGDSILMMVDADLKQALDADNAFRALERDRLSPGGYDKDLATWARANNVTIAPLSGE